MGNKAYVRRIVDQLCLHTSDIIPDIPIGGVMPEAEFFGATGLPGTTEIAADAGHRHAMPDIEDILKDDAFFFDDAVLTTPNQVFSISTSGGTTPTVLGGRDVVGAYGAFGSFDVKTNNSANGNLIVMMQNQTAVSASAQIHLWQRVKEVSIRIAPGIDIADLDRANVVVGGMRSSVNGVNALIVTSITDGVFFRLTTDASSVGNWECVAMNNGSSTVVATDPVTTYVNDGSNVGFQNFRISYDHTNTTATFFIDDVQVGIISTSIPPSTRLLAGFGFWVQNTNTGVARQLDSSFDRLLYVGHRIAPT